ncbi:hypothetical protein K2O51_30985 (plasmid) [Cupriavidus pinatubonensis]|uniref:hypothetical protein n=1 Tax=Cupriavidus pinatubonensis TaxID=248026 RepID=UPI001C739E49|nr:hypothetical protein [Cupriavidus pinatubonensis]QYY33675.1 hypothetical protein K2O51_30985 [Cupriavidus pinatubonensis]
MPTLEYLEFLSWVKRAMFFREDMQKQMAGLGIAKDVVDCFVFSEARRNGNVLDLFESYGRAEPEAFEAFLRDCWKQWEEAKSAAS